MSLFYFIYSSKITRYVLALVVFFRVVAAATSPACSHMYIMSLIPCRRLVTSSVNNSPVINNVSIVFADLIKMICIV